MPTFAPLNIVIAEDQTLILQGLTSILKQNGYNVSGTATDGKKLIELLRYKQPDIILLDLEMPIMDGNNALSIIKKEFPSIKVIIVSQYYDEQLIKSMFNKGANGYLSKNATNDELVTLINMVDKHNIYIDNLPKLLTVPAFKDGHYYNLIYTRREIEIIKYMCKGETYSTIAKRLFISEKTVENHTSSILKKSQVKTRAEFMIFANQHGLYFLGNEV